MREILATGKIAKFAQLKDVQDNSIKMRERKGQKAIKVTQLLLSC